MNKLIRLYNQNRKMFFIIITVIVAIILGLKLLNYLTIKNAENRETTNKSLTVEYDKDRESVTGEKKSKEIYNFEANIIEKFLNYCNNKEIENAYDMLSDDCKTNLYPSIDDFIDGYYKINFNDKKLTYSTQLWSENTYKIELRENILSTGIYSDSAYVEDFYTIVGNKLNISGFIKRKVVNEELTNENINIRINSLDYYTDYTICNFQVFNHTEKDILISDLQNSEDIVLIDSKENKYEFYNNELNEDNLKISSKQLKQVSIKFNVLYRRELEIEAINFQNVIQNYDDYKENKLLDDEKIQFEINL